jgi:hypothetical protein
MDFNCVVCGFKGKDKSAIDRHNETDKHMENLGMKLVNNLELKDIRKMTTEEVKNYIENHKYFQEYNPLITKFFIKKNRSIILNKILEDAGIGIPAGKYSVPFNMTNLIKKQEISEEYSTDDDSDEKYERMNAVDYSNDEIKKVHEEFIEWQNWWLFSHEGRKANASLGAAKQAVKNRMIMELEATEKAKLLLEQKSAKDSAKLNKQLALLELKKKEMEIKMLS